MVKRSRFVCLKDWLHATISLSSESNSNGRLRFLEISIFIILTGITSRYAYLAVVPSAQHTKLLGKATRQFETEIKISPSRRAIVDRMGRPLALSVLRPSLFIIPRKIPADQILEIAERIHVSAASLHKIAATKRNFTWLQRKLSPQEFEALGDISDWKDFMGYVDEPKRIYPEKDLAAHLIGYVGLDDNGLEGVEKVYNAILKEKDSTVKVSRDARGKLTLIAPNRAAQPELQGEPLRLSVDLSIQGFAESALKNGVVKAQATGGSVVVSDIETGELLAIASYPTFDINNQGKASLDKKRFRPVMDALELGSVTKPIFIAAALDAKSVDIKDSFYCEHGILKVPGGYIRDDHPKDWLIIKDVIKYSSNICSYKIAQKLGRDKFYIAAKKAGLTRAIGTGLPGEWVGHLTAPDTWKEMRFANLSFGQGLAISPLQLNHAIATLTGGGTDMGTHILATDKETAVSNNPKLEFISSQTSKAITNLMTSVVEEEGGTGRRAAIPGVTVAGKTGTAQKYNPILKKYSERTSSFVGVFPAEQPKFAITVVIDEPKVRPAYGGLLAGPVFAEIGTNTLQYLNSKGLFELKESITPIAQRNKGQHGQ